MKTLSESQKLYLVIANDDYIYGTNYQFCHGYIGKDAQMSQEKILQGLGRIGRFQLHQPCTMRFRSIDQIHKLFRAENETMKPEVINFTRLFRR